MKRRFSAGLTLAMVLSAGCFEPGGGQVTREAPSFRLDPGQSQGLVLVSELTGPAYPYTNEGGAGWTDIMIRGETRGPQLNSSDFDDLELVFDVTEVASGEPVVSGGEDPSAWSELSSEDGPPGDNVRWHFSGGASFPSFGTCEPTVPCLEEVRVDLFWDAADRGFQAPTFEVTVSAFVSSEWAPLTAESTAQLEVGWRAP